MMMPANYSAISENEMTYVNGGAIALEDILAPKLTVENWKTFNTNMVTLIGNAYVGNYVKNTLGTLFSGTYTPGKIAMGYGSTVSKIWNANAAAPNASNWVKFRQGSYGVLNVALNLAGNAAAIYNLATGGVKNGLPKVFTYDNQGNVSVA